MKFHTNLTLDQMRSVQLPRGVSWYRLEQQGSRSRTRKFDMILTGGSNYGGQFGAQDYAAATWDEWGVVLGRLFELDPSARVPGVYEGFYDFHELTMERYYPSDLPDVLCKRHKWTIGQIRYQECSKCGAGRSWHTTPIGDQNPPSERGLTPEGEAHWQAHRPSAQARAAMADVIAAMRYDDEPAEDLGKYASNGAYERDLLARIDELTSC